MLIDSHCHIHDTDTHKFALSRYPKLDPADYTPKQLLKRAQASDVKQVICVGTTHQDSLAARDFAAQHNNVFWSYGIHPSEANSGEVSAVLRHASLAPVFTGLARSRSAAASARSAKTADTSPPIAIGEIGLDYHYQDADRRAQIKLFEQLLQLATDQNLPVIFHIREAFDDFFAILHNFPKIKTGVVHSFSDSPANLDKILQKTDFYIGVNGIATFANIPLPPIERMLLETDAPFLTPNPHRNQPNEPAQIKTIAEFIAQKNKANFQQVAAKTTANAQTLFHLPPVK